MNTHQQRGFTLLEMLVAVFIFSISLVSLATISSRGIVVANNAINQATAQFLAQEGIELVESRRDDNFLTSGADWLDGLSACESPDVCYAASYDASYNPEIIFTVCPGGVCPNFSRTASGLYWYNVGEPTLFKRIIAITDGNTTNTAGELEDRVVRSRVEWVRNGVTYSVESQKSIFNWL